MKIKNRLSVQFTFLVFGILMFFSFLVYYFSHSSHQAEFRDNLLARAENTAILLIEVEEVDSTLLNKIHRTTRSLENEELAIFDASGKLMYHTEMDYLSGIAPLPGEGKHLPDFFTVKEKEGVRYSHLANGQYYQVYVLAYNRSKVVNQKRLRNILGWSILVSLVLSVTVSFIFSKMAILPVTQMVSDIKEINTAKLSKRLNEGKRKDEIEQLAVTFNQMLSDLEISFKIQDEFISHASHELRTPLAIMIAGSEYILSRERSKEEYVQQLTELRDNLRYLNTLLNSLLELAHLNRENKMEVGPVRLDELIFSSIQSTKSKYPGRKIVPRIEYPENEDDLMVTGNPGFLEIAFNNLLDNACKFSSLDIDVEISPTSAGLLCRIKDHGIGIPDGEIEKIFAPFRRARNAAYIGGYGIGLSLVRRILSLHGATIAVSSIEGVETTFEIFFRKEGGSTTSL